MITDYILNLFNSSDVLRRLMHTPHKIGEYTYATDAHSVIRIKNENLGFQYESDDKFPRADTIYNIDAWSEYTVSVEKMANAVARAKLIYLGDVCKKCSGEGYVTCECCENTSDCKNCKGEGTVDTHQFRIAIGQEVAAIKIGERFFKPFLVERLLITALALNCTEVKISNNLNDTKATLFMVNDIEIILMPTIMTEDVVGEFDII